MITCDLSHYDNPQNPNSGFGNQLFKIVGTIGIAIKHGYTYGFDRQYSCFVNKLPELEDGKRKEIKISWGYHDIKIKDNVIIETYSYLQSEKYFKHCENLIRMYFTLKKLSDIEISQGSIAIHFRGGDYGSEHHPRMTKEYYDNALKYMPGGKVYIFSDEQESARKIFGNNYEYVDTGYYMTDFYLGVQCAHFIISNSSFPWWMAWLSNKGGIVVAPKNWFGPAKNISPKDIYCKNWRVI